MRQAFGLLSILLLWGLGWHAGPGLADEPNQAGLVVQFDEGRVETLCLEFEGDEISGNELLVDSGLDMVVDTTTMGVRVCQIEGQGCVPPGEHCFCQCMGIGSSGCAYWNYFYRDPGAEGWTYSNLGAALRRVQPGSVEAWVWGDGRTPPSDDLTFAAICGLPTPPPTATAAASPSLPSSPTPIPPEAKPTAAQIPTRTPEPAPSPTASPPTAPTPTSTPTPTPTPETTPSLTTYLPFGLMVLVLALIGAFVWLRRS